MSEKTPMPITSPSGKMRIASCVIFTGLRTMSSIIAPIRSIQLPDYRYDFTVEYLI
jgi:hypothetical protein